MPYEIVLDGIPAGYAITSAKKGERLDVIAREFTSTEDGDLFVGRLEGFPTTILKLIPEKHYSAPVVDHLLAIISPDKKVKVFINELKIHLSIQPKKAFEKGQPVMLDDIANIIKLEIQGVEIPINSGFAFLFSIGWRKGFYYDFTPLHTGSPNLEYKPDVLLGQLYAYLSFQELFKITTDDWKYLFSQQWFPFISLSHDTIRKIIECARNDWIVDDLLDKIRGELTGRFDDLIAAWKKNKYFQEHCELLEHAIKRYIEGDYISSTAILYPRIEGIMRSYHLSKRENEKASQGNLVSTVINIGSENKYSYNYLLPKYFDTYLKQVYFADFDPKNPRVVSRHTVSHGVAPAGDFSLKSATIALLIVGQLTYYLRQ